MRDMNVNVKIYPKLARLIERIHVFSDGSLFNLSSFSGAEADTLTDAGIVKEHFGKYKITKIGLQIIKKQTHNR